MANVVDPMLTSPWATPARDPAIGQAAGVMTGQWAAGLNSLYPGFGAAAAALLNAYGSLTWSGNNLTTFRDNVASSSVAQNAGMLRQLAGNQAGLANYINAAPFQNARPTSLGSWHNLSWFTENYINPYIVYVINALSQYFTNQPPPPPIVVPPIRTPSG